MRQRLDWDVLFVLEEDELRRAPDIRHYRLAHDLRRTLVTMDRDYLDDRRFPPGETSGVLVIQAPDQQQLTKLVERIDRALFHPDPDGTALLPVDGRKLHLHTDWTGESGADAE